MEREREGGGGERERERGVSKVTDESQVLRGFECYHAEYVLVGNLDSNYESLQSKATIMQCSVW